MAAGVCLYVACRSPRGVGSIIERGVARRSFGLLRRDLWLPIDPSASGPSAGYVSRHATSYHKLPRGSTVGGGPSRLRPLAAATLLCRGSHATTPRSRSAIAAPL